MSLITNQQSHSDWGGIEIIFRATGCTITADELPLTHEGVTTGKLHCDHVEFHTIVLVTELKNQMMINQ